MAKVKPPSLKEMIEERNRLLVSRENPERVAELNAKIDFIEYGIQ